MEEGMGISAVCDDSIFLPLKDDLFAGRMHC